LVEFSSQLYDDLGGVREITYLLLTRKRTFSYARISTMFRYFISWNSPGCRYYWL